MSHAHPKDSKVRLSRYCFIFQRQTAICLYHSLGISPVYLDIGYLPLFEALQSRSLTYSEIQLISPVDKKSTIKLLRALQSKFFIVTDDYDETQELLEIQKKILEHPSVSIMYLLLTDSCNLSCTYCYIKNSLPADHTASKMTPLTAKQAIVFFSKQVQIAEINEPTIIFYGGEPLLNVEAIEAAVEEIDRLKKNRELPEKTHVQLVTNGTLITPQIARFLKKHEFIVAISIDSPYSEDSKQRTAEKPTLHEKIMLGFNELKKTGIAPGISCTLTEENLRNFPRLLQWLANETNISGVGFNIVRPIPPFTVAPQYADEVSQALIQGYEFLSNLRINEDRMQRKIHSFSTGTIYPYDCAGCGGQLVIAPNGDVGVCAGFLGTRKYFMTTVADMAFNHQLDKTFLEWSLRSPLSMKACSTCQAIAICGGGCPYSAEINKGGLLETDDVFCAHAKKTLEYLIWKLFEKLR